jgi:hypothetical protein
MPFLIDSGSNCSVINASMATRLRIPVPQVDDEFDLRLGTATGPVPIRVRRGRIQLWWNEGCLGYRFDWPVLFRVDSDPASPNLLGLGGVIQTCRWTFDGTWSTSAPYGTLTLEDIR